VLSVAVGWRKDDKGDIYTRSLLGKGSVGKERPAEDDTAEDCIVEQCLILIVAEGFRWWCICQVCGV
jgi:hypothetical protein